MSGNPWLNIDRDAQTLGSKTGPLTDGQYFGATWPNWFSIKEASAAGLLALMQGISEEFYCAGWDASTEFELWNAQTGHRFGRGQLSEREALLLRELSLACDGWWMWDDEERFVFVKRAKFQKLYDAWKAGRTR
ncbi:hypothetical protein [Rhabdaerophilum sp. SD176]|uniref:hypothetical protein n=1 Tax=Rhabdaerophilum sp. SD176 TaxID=2983548 RepID=UPI0024DFBC3B|nr:hypothetical protein [Rhabdaerophilum sp. SD176]